MASITEVVSDHEESSPALVDGAIEQVQVSWKLSLRSVVPLSVDYAPSSKCVKLGRGWGKGYDALEVLEAARFVL